MASGSGSSGSPGPSTTTKASPSSISELPSVSSMIRKGFISDPLISSTVYPAPPNFGGVKYSKVSIPPSSSSSPNIPTTSKPPSPLSRSPPSSPPASIPSPSFKLTSAAANNRSNLSSMSSAEKSSGGSKSPAESHRDLHNRIREILKTAPFRISDKWGPGDVSVTVGGKPVPGDGGSSSYIEVILMHKSVLSAKSSFFAEKLRGPGFHSIEILDCDDVAAYVEAIVLMYYDELKTTLRLKEVSEVLTLVKIFADISFRGGVRACLDYLEVAPWTEDEEQSVVSILNELQVDNRHREAVLQRVVVQPSGALSADEIFMKLLLGILEAKDDKVRKITKSLVLELLDNETKDDRPLISKDTMYHLCHKCVTSLLLSFSGATSVDESGTERGALMDQIAREAENILWIARILIIHKLGEEFVKLWADQKELSVLHSKIPTRYRHEISKVTASLLVSIGAGQILVPKETKFALLSTWLQPLYDDFGWLRSSGKSFDKNVVERGLSQTILTLPMSQQQSILLDWFDRFLNRGDDCPNIRNAFEVWWRRSFIRQYENDSMMQITVSDNT